MPHVGEDEADKVRMISDLAAALEGQHSVNDLTSMDGVPDVLCGRVWDGVLAIVWGLMQKFPGKPVVISKMDVASAFRHFMLELSSELLGFRWGDTVVIQLRLPMGWTASPGTWELAGQALA